MADNIVNQSGSSNYQSSANGKKGRSKMIVNNFGGPGGREPNISLEETKQLAGNSIAYRLLAVVSGIASVAGLVVAVLPLFSGGIGKFGAWETSWPSYAALVVFVTLAIVSLIALRVLTMMRKHLIALSPSSYGPALVGRDRHLHRIRLTGVCPIDGGDLRFRNGPHEWTDTPQPNGRPKRTVTKRGPVATCARDASHTWGFSRAVAI